MTPLKSVGRRAECENETCIAAYVPPKTVIMTQQSGFSAIDMIQIMKLNSCEISLATSTLFSAVYSSVSYLFSDANMTAESCFWGLFWCSGSVCDNPRLSDSDPLYLLRAAIAGGKVVAWLASSPLSSEIRTPLCSPCPQTEGGEAEEMEGQTGVGDWAKGTRGVKAG